MSLGVLPQEVRCDTPVANGSSISLEVSLDARTEIAHCDVVSICSLVQRLFSTFPQGAPGVAILVLRLSAAGQMYLSYTAGRFDSIWVAAPALVLSGALILGFVTPIAAWGSAAWHCASIFLLGDLTSAPHAAVAAATAAAIAVLGPGAYSVDSRLFGRRLVDLSKTDDSTRP